MTVISNSKKILWACLLGMLFTGVALAQTPPVNGNSSPYNDCISKNESDDPSFANKWGYTGLYQFSARSAAASGLCSNYNVFTDKMTFGQSAATWADFNARCDFRGAVARQYGVTSYAGWTTGANATAIQNAMMNNFNQQNINMINANGWNQYYGQTFNGVVMDQNTMLAMLHLGGPSRLATLLAGGTPKLDGNGVSITGYAKCLQACLAGQSGNCNMKAQSVCSDDN